MVTARSLFKVLRLDVITSKSHDAPFIACPLAESPQVIVVTSIFRAFRRAFSIENSSEVLKRLADLFRRMVLPFEYG